MTKVEVAKLVQVLLASFPNAQTNVGTSMAYERMLADLDHAEAQAAVERLIATSKWLPTVAEIRETAHTISIGEQRPGGDAWGSVLSAIKAQGSYRKPGIDFVFKDPITARCVAALNWEELCLSENQAADRARFIELYDKLAIQDRHRSLSESLPAMQRYRAIEERKRSEISTGDAAARDARAVLGESSGPRSIAQLLPMVPTND